MKFFLVKIAHDNTPNKTYTFRSSSRFNVGELAVCRTRYGYTYGIVVEINKTSYEETRKYSGVATKANKRMFAKLSPYDRATIILKNTEDLETAMHEFDFTNVKAATAFLYNEARAFYVNTYNEDGNVFINVYKGIYSENDKYEGFELAHTFCLG